MYKSNWEEKLSLLVEYLDENDGQYPKSSEYYKNVALGSWINTQRVVFNKGELQEDGSIEYNGIMLTKEKIDKLNEINFLWHNKKKMVDIDAWLIKYDLLKEYLKEYNGKYPKFDDEYKGVKIGKWVQRQKATYNNGILQEDGSIRYNSYILTKNQIDKLDEINFIWSTREILWEDKYEVLKKYLSEHNGEYPYQNEYYEGVAIGSWVNTQRTIYNNGEKLEDGSIRYNSTTLTKERIEKLNKIGFVWNLNIKELQKGLWINNYKLLQEYLRENDGKYPKSNEKYKGVFLGRWVILQRTIYNNGERMEDGSIKYNSYILSIDRINKLNEINFRWTNINELLWEDKYELLKEYLNTHDGNFPSVNDEYKGIRIGEWIQRQKTIYTCGEKLEDGSIIYNFTKLSKERIEKLDEINFPWFSYCSWNYMYELLMKYIKEHNGEYPKKEELYEDVELSKWVNLQKLIYNNGKKQMDGTIKYCSYSLTQEKIDKLNNIGFVWTNLSDEIWNKKYELLKEYLNTHEGNYPNRDEVYKGVNLGIWINDLRSIYSNGHLQSDGSIRYNNHIITKGRIEKLNKIKFIWILYTKKDYIMKLKSQKNYALIKKKILYRMYKTLDESKNEIKEKEDVKQIEKEFVKSLTLFN